MNIKKKLLLSDLENREFLIIYKSISSREIKIPPVSILSNTLILKKLI